jgi:uncharacterized protein involved in outer membrane biogenesis
MVEFMERVGRLRLLWTAIGVFAVVAVLAFTFRKLVPDDATVVERIRAQVEARLGVEVGLGAAHLQLWPQTELVVENVQTVQPQPIRIRRLVAHLAFMPLLHSRLQIDRMEIDGAVLPQLSLRALRMRPPPAAPEANPVQVAQLEFRDVVWITRFGNPLEFSGSASFGPDWQLRTAQLVRPGVRPVTRLALASEGVDRWSVRIQLGGGSADGHVMVKSSPGGVMALTGQLVPNDIDLTAALASFKRHSAVQGRASGQTELAASGHTAGELARSLQTRTTFSVARARLLHIDVDKAIRSLGKDRAGETALQSLRGQMDTQNSADGMVVRYTALQAKGETFSASGSGTIANRRIDGELTVDLAGGLVGIPLKVSGPLTKPEVSVPTRSVAGATAGAVIGTALLPGIGTAIGASVGAAVGKLFGGGDTKRPASPR